MDVASAMRSRGASAGRLRRSGVCRARGELSPAFPRPTQEDSHIESDATGEYARCAKLRLMRATFVATRAFLLLTLALLLTSGCGARTTDVQAPTPAQARTELAGSPAALAALHEQGARLLDGGLDAYRARLAALRGHPVVVNAWASGCGPCKYEMPYFSRAAVRFGRRV